MGKFASKTKALLAKAASTDSEHERDSLTEAAERLMVKWGVSEAMLDEAKGSDRKAKIIMRKYEVRQRGGSYLARFVAPLVASGVAPIKTLAEPKGSTWYAVGYEGDLDRIEMYVPALVDQAAGAWKAWSKTGYFLSNSERNNARRSFMLSFGTRVRKRLEEIFQAEIEGEGTGAELVLVDRRAAVEKKVGEFFPRVHQPRMRRWSETAGVAGDRAGSATTISAGQVSA